MGQWGTDIVGSVYFKLLASSFYVINDWSVHAHSHMTSTLDSLPFVVIQFSFPLTLVSSVGDLVGSRTSGVHVRHPYRCRSTGGVYVIVSRLIMKP